MLVVWIFHTHSLSLSVVSVRIETLDGLECLYSDDEESQNAVDDEDDSNGKCV